MKLKKILSLMLAAVMLLSAVAMPSYAEGTDESEPARYAEVIDIMKSLGLTDSFSVEYETTNITRIEFVAAILELSNRQIVKVDCPFSDVSEADKDLVGTAYRYGIIKGDGKVFRPNDILTFEEAVTMLVNLLGYSQFVPSIPGKAKILGIMDNVEYEPSKPVTAGEAVQMLFNTGSAHICTTDGNGYVTESDITVFDEYHDIVKGYGIMNGNAYTTLDSTSNLQVNRVRIGNVIKNIYYSSEVIDFMGCNVEYYYNKETDDILYIGLKSGGNKIEKINADDVVGFANNTLTYADGNNLKTTNIPGETPVIYNGTLTLDYTYTNAAGQNVTIFEPDNGEITLIDNNTDGRVDVVQILAYDNVIVSAVNKTDGIIYDKFNSNLKIDFDDNENQDDVSWIITDADGNIISLDKIEEWDVISVARGRNNYALRGVWTRNSLTGTITAKGTKNGNQYISLDGKEYCIAKDIRSYIPNIGSKVTLYFDFLGRIAAVKSDEGVEMFGYLIEWDKETDTPFNDTYLARIMNSYGKVETMKFAKNVKIDGTMRKGGTAVKTAIEAMENAWMTQKAAAYANISPTGGQEVGSVDTMNEDKADKRIVILYKLNKDSEINYIDSPVKGTNEDDYTLSAVTDRLRKLTWHSEIKSFGNKYPFSSGTTLFKVPSVSMMSDTDLYNLQDTSTLIGDTGYIVRAYKRDPESHIPELIEIVSDAGSSTLRKSSKALLVTDIAYGLNSEEATALIVTGYNESGNEVQYSVNYDYDSLASNVKTYALDPDDLKVGDVVKIAFNERNEINEMSLLFDSENETYGPFPKNNAGLDGRGWFGSGFYCDFGRLHEFNGTTITLLSKQYGVNTADMGSDEEPHFYNTRTTTKMYKVEKGARKTSVTDITSDPSQFLSVRQHKSNVTTFVYVPFQAVKMVIQYTN